MRIQLENLKSIFVRAIQEARPNPSPDERMRLYAAQYTVMEGANDIARLAIRTCGGQSMMKHLPLERIYRDSRCGSLMCRPRICMDGSAGSAVRAGEATSRCR